MLHAAVGHRNLSIVHSCMSKCIQKLCNCIYAWTYLSSMVQWLAPQLREGGQEFESHKSPFYMWFIDSFHQSVFHYATLLPLTRLEGFYIITSDELLFSNCLMLLNICMDDPDTLGMFLLLETALKFSNYFCWLSISELAWSQNLFHTETSGDRASIS